MIDPLLTPIDLSDTPGIKWAKLQRWVALLANNIASSGGSLPSQGGNAGFFLTTNGTTASWAPITASVNLTAYSVLANTTGSTALGVSSQSIVLGAPGFSDTGILGQFTSGVAGYYQSLLQNTSNNAAASADIIVANDQGTATTHYGDFGINSSTFSGTGSLALPGATYLYSQTGDLVLGTNTSNAIHFVVNNGATDAATFSTSGNLSLFQIPVIDLGSMNGTLPSAIASNIIVRMGNADGVASGFQSDSFGASGFTFSARAASGTRASPTATASGQTLLIFNAFGFGTALTTSPSASYAISANSLWSATNQETRHRWTGTPSGSTASSLWMNLDGLNGLTLDLPFAQTPIVRTSGVSSYFSVSAPADTGITTATESVGVNFIGATRTWVDGTVATQREYLIQAPTYAKTTTSATFTKAATFAISAAPIAGSGVTITNPYALWVQAGLAQFDGGLTNTGVTTLTPAARAASAPYFLLTIPADTAQTASTESIGYQHATGSRQWATTGTVALQRENFFAGPTYTSASASQTFTDAFTLYATPPIAGSNAIFTRGHTLGIVDATSAASSITGGFVIATTLGTTATSVGIGGGNVNAGGLITGGTITSTGLFTASSTSTFTGVATHNNAVIINGATSSTALTLTNTARTSGVLPYIKWTIPTDTSLTLSTEAPGLLTVTGTRQWATGALALQRENLFVGPTIAFVGASTLTDGFTMGITPVLQGTNATITRAHSLGILGSNSATTSITGELIVAAAFGTAATSTGIGNGNVVTGGNLFASTSTGRVGYATGTGAGSAVTQLSSRTTGVTINTPTGAITLFAAAGSVTATTFTVTCSSVAAVDTIIVNQVSGSNLYMVFVTAVAAGSFNITFLTTGGITSDSPVFNYSVIKGSST